MKPIPIRSNANLNNPLAATIYVEGATTAHDMLHGNGRGLWGRETVAEVRRKHPGQKVSVITWQEANKRARAAALSEYCKPVEEITAEQFNEWLNVLPPENWQNGREVNIFRMSEYYTGKITRHVARVDGRYFTALREAGPDTYHHLVTEIHTFIATAG
jgi:nicotinamide mononucleotide adenylyltransferase